MPAVTSPRIPDSPAIRGRPRITVICGGVGAARFLRALTSVVDPSTVTAIINVADDMVLHGLSISPDIDTVTYTLAEAIDPERGWGLRNETWAAMDALGRYGDRNWFRLGDQDLATHLQRTARLAEGSTLTDVTSEIGRAWGIDVTLLPVSNDPVSTRVTRADTGDEISFQQYFVGEQHDIALSSVRFEGIEHATATPEVLAALDAADIIVIAPSNPLVSIAPVVDIPGIREAIEQRSVPCIAISPIVGGTALKGPAARMLAELGHDATAIGVAQLWSALTDVLVIDDQDAHRAGEIASIGVVPYVTDTIMAGPTRSAALARAVLSAARIASSIRPTETRS
jgi:LPPG:FO 2-phospho-L-lactate transferase